jgi:hypothetical protein
METLNLIGSFASIVSLLISLFVLNKVNSINTHLNNKVEQKNNIVGNDMAGRNINK